ncbi:hypothetical protein SAMD00023353_3300260 [Rosellinia necatrix]|uniref:Uncharacterized protein n=1 Tax=Rosellinia necatrix TaxID=77044 RepID=A0A1S8A923_ROSNE|nr:hypothetical protein SAMD00023353_3300260 [Rosellinia necatrix]
MQPRSRWSVKNLSSELIIRDRTRLVHLTRRTKRSVEFSGLPMPTIMSFAITGTVAQVLAVCSVVHSNKIASECLQASEASIYNH